MIEYTTLRVERPKPQIAVAYLDRPDRLNAITFRMFDEFAALQTEIESDPDTRVLILTGSGRGFCAGLDLDQAATLPAMSAAEMLTAQESWARSVSGFQRMTTPVIAAVNGPAAGAGLSLALAADIRIASAAAKFNAAFVRIGLSGGDLGTSWALPRLLGLGRATEILLTGRFVDASEALRIGLVTDVCEPDDLLDRALEIAERIRGNSPVGMALTKQVIQTNVDASSLEAALSIENRNQVLATRTADMREALAAFREKRTPRFAGE
ncbi:enoyl-CoA hydratase/isomerase family protein [Nocardia sp. CA-120079]|uniref:enoyl-CoA hydratase/isomerase family protein n=1 Tax=Nocardia sp. CA-120079 TaxID=3239974 RepID=UPI003D970F5A